jgi:hypothetical protein
MTDECLKKIIRATFSRRDLYWEWNCYKLLSTSVPIFLPVSLEFIDDF